MGLRGRQASQLKIMKLLHIYQNNEHHWLPQHWSLKTKPCSHDSHLGLAESGSGEPQAAIVQIPWREDLRQFILFCHFPRGHCLTRNLFDLSWTWGPPIAHCDLEQWLTKTRKTMPVFIKQILSAMPCFLLRGLAYSLGSAALWRPEAWLWLLHPCSPISFSS